MAGAEIARAAEAADAARQMEQVDIPENQAEAIASDTEMMEERQDYHSSVDTLHDELTEIVLESEGLTNIDRKMALDDVKALFGEIKSRMETFGYGQRTRIKVQKKIGGIFKVELGQQFTQFAGEEPGTFEAKPYKLRLRATMVPLGVAFGHEQYADKESPMGLADKHKQFVEIKLYDDGTTGVKLQGGRKIDDTGEERKVTRTARLSATPGKMYLHTEMAFKKEQALREATSANLIATMKVKKVQVGAFANLSAGSAEGGLQVLGSF